MGPVLMTPRQRQRLVKGASLQEPTEQAWQHGLRLGHRVQAGGQRGGAWDRETMQPSCYKTASLGLIHQNAIKRGNRDEPRNETPPPSHTPCDRVTLWVIPTMEVSARETPIGYT